MPGSSRESCSAFASARSKRCLSPARVPGLSFVDKHTYPARLFTAADGIRVVPGGSSVRAGAYIARGVVCMPPMYINAGAYVDEGTMVDSHALVGSCAQIGKRVHLSAAAQIGGVLEPVNASPVVIEDDVLVGGNCGVYEGTIVRKGAVLAAGTILTRGTPVFDLVNGKCSAPPPNCPSSFRRTPSSSPARAPSTKAKAIPKAKWGLSLYAPVIVKYRDEKTDLSTTLEDFCARDRQCQAAIALPSVNGPRSPASKSLVPVSFEPVSPEESMKIRSSLFLALPLLVLSVCAAPARPSSPPLPTAHDHIKVQAREVLLPVVVRQARRAGHQPHGQRLHAHRGRPPAGHQELYHPEQPALPPRTAGRHQPQRLLGHGQRAQGRREVHRPHAPRRSESRRPAATRPSSFILIAKSSCSRTSPTPATSCTTSSMAWDPTSRSATPGP